MRELDAILGAWRGLDEADGGGVLATVVHVKGSAYRRPGARMLILPGGCRIGTISGGCLEGDLTKKAWWYTEGGAPVVQVYDTTSDDDAVWEFGLGCNGVIHVLLERVESAVETLEYLAGQRRRGAAAVVAVAIRDDAAAGVRTGDRLFLDADGVAGGRLAQARIGAAVTEYAALALRERRSFLLHLGDAQVFVECVAPPMPVVIFGAGHDAVPLVACASAMGWSVTVADGRPAYARPERFPGADRVIVVGDDLFRDVRVDRETAVVLMTHNYPLDARLLPGIVDAQPQYLGMLGPRRRAERLFADCGLTPPAGLHAPAGLDTGGDTPEGIALAIAAEIQTAISGRSGGMLKHRSGPIHAPWVEIGEARAAAEGVRPGYCETRVGSYV